MKDSCCLTGRGSPSAVNIRSWGKSRRAVCRFRSAPRPSSSNWGRIRSTRPTIGSGRRSPPSSPRAAVTGTAGGARSCCASHLTISVMRRSTYCYLICRAGSPRCFEARGSLSAGPGHLSCWPSALVARGDDPGEFLVSVDAS
jgi:hypothetical protein